LAKKKSYKGTAIKNGFRSGLEEVVSNQLTTNGIATQYESKDNIIPYIVPATNHKYLPDFKLPNGIIVETKGRFVLSDRKKHLLIKQQHPNLDIRFVFTSSKNKISKASKTTYADWCIKNGFKYADKLIPDSWINE
jgi:hypothetical protein